MRVWCRWIPGEVVELVAVEDRGASARLEPDGAETFEVSQSSRGNLTDCPDLRCQLVLGGKDGDGAGSGQPQEHGREARHDMPKRQLSDERAQLADSLGQDVADGQADLGIPHYEATPRAPRKGKANGGVHPHGRGP